MGYLLSKEQIQKLKQDISENQQLKVLWDNMYERTMEFTKAPQLSNKQDTIKWWHLIWERLGDAAFVCAIMPNEQLSTYVHDVVMDVCGKDINEWIGPWFRTREAELIAKLETAHVGIAVAVAYDMCSDLFNDDEKVVIFKALKEKCQILCKKFLDGLYKKVNNWFMVVLNGYATVSCVLNDRDAVLESIEIYNILLKGYNSDSYGESVQYSNYASLHLCHMHEMIAAYDASLTGKLDCKVYGNLMKWYAASFMYMKPLYGEWGETEVYPRTLNFGDSAAIFRPNGDLLIHLSTRLKNTDSTNAGLARWLFDVTYENPAHGPSDRSTFGFINNYHYLSIMLFTQSASPVSPEKADMPLLDSFETGTIVLRDRWENPEFVLGVQGGYKGNNITNHRHLDQNSFMVSYMKERMIIDPGHCCYRLQSHWHSAGNEAHSTWIFERENGETIQQKIVEGNFMTGINEPMNILKVAKKIDDLTVISSDCAKVYGDDFIRAERSWISFNSNILFIVDRIKAKTPVVVNTNYVVNNRNNVVDERVFYGNRVVIRRNGVGMKLLPLSVKEENLKMRPAWGFANDCYHPEPNNLGQGKEGSTLIYKYITEEFRCEHTNVYVVILDKEQNIAKWHAQADNNSYHIDPPDHAGGLTVNIVNDNLIEIIDCGRNKTYNFDSNGLVERD